MTNPTIIIPYRDRQQHLEIFIPAMRLYLPDAPIIVVEQADGKPFNRGRLLNIGFLETKPNYFVAHDVDLIPIEVDYSNCKTVAQLAISSIQLIDYLGGATMFNKKSFEKVGGYHNDYFHRAEDNCLMANLRRLWINVELRYGKFESLHHPRTGPEFIPHLWKKAQQRRKVQNQLGCCKYKVISNEQKEGYTLLKVEL